MFIICEVTPVGFEPTTPRLKVECIYQLSYEVVVHPEGFEPTTLALKVRYSSHLSYECI